MPVLVLTGEKASGQFLIDQAGLVATNVKGVIVEGSGHWLIDEAPGKVIPALVSFLDEVPGRAQDAGAQRRLAPTEIDALAPTGAGREPRACRASGRASSRVTRPAPASTPSSSRCRRTLASRPTIIPTIGWPPSSPEPGISDTERPSTIAG